MLIFNLKNIQIKNYLNHSFIDTDLFSDRGKFVFRREGIALEVGLEDGDLNFIKMIFQNYF